MIVRLVPSRLLRYPTQHLAQPPNVRIHRHTLSPDTERQYATSDFRSNAVKANEFRHNLVVGRIVQVVQAELPIFLLGLLEDASNRFSLIVGETAASNSIDQFAFWRIVDRFPIAYSKVLCEAFVGGSTVLVTRITTQDCSNNSVEDRRNISTSTPLILPFWRCVFGQSRPPSDSRL